MTKYIIEVTVPDDIDPSRILELAQEMVADLVDESDLTEYESGEEDWDLALKEQLGNEVSVQLVKGQ